MIGRLKDWFRKRSVPQQSVPSDRILRLQSGLGITIPEEDFHLFYKALRHRSIVDNEQFEAHETYERLEFLGDAVLDLIVTEILFDKYPTENEGFLTKLRSKIVKGDTLSILARELSLNEALEVGQRASGQGIELSKSVLADVYEAIIAAIYISMGYEEAFRFVQSNMDKFLNFETLEKKIDNYKSLLMEYTQSERMPLPSYKIISEEGPGHDKTFFVAVFVDRKKMGEGTGKSKKKAEQLAARNALDELGLSGS